MDIKNVRNLSIAKNKFDFAKDIKQELNYQNWVEYVSAHSDFFIWAEHTPKGKEALAGIDKIPESFRERVLSTYNKGRCYAKYDMDKGQYDIGITFHEELKKIAISFEKKVTKEDLIKLLNMANYLGAYLLNNGNEIIDEKVIENLI